MEPAPAQIETYRRDGFVVVEQFLPPDEVERLREHFLQCFEHRWETGVMPDEVNYQPGVTPPDKTRQLCNLWKADRTIGATTLSARNAEFAARLEGEPGMRLFIDNAVWKPAGGKALLAHQDSAYQGYFDPANLTTCWMALDDTHADTGTIYYARGSHLWGRMPWVASSTRRTTGPATPGKSPRPSSTTRSSGCRSRCPPAERRSTPGGRSTARRPTSGPTASGVRSSAT